MKFNFYNVQGTETPTFCANKPKDTKASDFVVGGKHTTLPRREDKPTASYGII